MGYRQREHLAPPRDPAMSISAMTTEHACLVGQRWKEPMRAFGKSKVEKHRWLAVPETGTLRQ